MKLVNIRQLFLFLCPILTKVDLLTNATNTSILGVVTGVLTQSSKIVTLQQRILCPRTAQLVQEDWTSTMTKVRPSEGFNSI